MNIKTFLLTSISMFLSFRMISQQMISTVISGSKSYANIKFDFDERALETFEVVETSLKITDGEIESNRKSTDTFKIRQFKIDETYDGYELVFTAKEWADRLFIKDCLHLNKEIATPPPILLKRNRNSNKLSFLEPNIVGSFMKPALEKSIPCSRSFGDYTMASAFEKWIGFVDSNRVDTFIPGLIMPFFNLVLKMDYPVPTQYQDTILTRVKGTSFFEHVEESYYIYKELSADSSTTITLTNQISATPTPTQEFTEKLYRAFENNIPETERLINEIRLKSMKEEERTIIELSKTGMLSRVININQSSILDSKLRTTFYIDNYEIRKIQ